MLIGYARVSTLDQNLELQTEALTKAGCKKIFEDRISGSRTERPGLLKTQEALRDGDTLVVWKLDRLGRSVKHLVDLVGQLHKQGVQFKSLTDSIDTATPSGRFFFHVMASLAEMERELTNRTNSRRPRSRSSAWPQRRTQTADDRKQNQIGQETPRQRSSPTGRRQQPRSLCAYPLQVDSGLKPPLAFILEVKPEV